MANNVFSTMSRRSFLTKTAATAGAVAGVGSLLEACGAASSGTVTLTLVVDGTEVTKDQIAEFERLNHGIKLNVIANDPTKIAALFAAGTPPDLVRAIGVTDTPYLATRGLALSLDSYISKSSVIKESDLAKVNDVWKYDGKAQGKGSRYGLAKDYSQDNMFWYDKSLFDAAGLAYPSETKPLTYTEWLDLGNKLTVREGDKIKVYGLDAFWIDMSHVINMVQSQGGSVFSDDLTKVDFSAPAPKAALQWYVDFAMSRVGPTPLDPNADGWDWPPFQAKRIAMVNYGYWFGGVVAGDTAATQARAGFAPAPQFGSKRTSPCMAATGYYITKASKHPDEAWKFLEYFMGGKPAQDRAASGFGLPGLVSLESKIPQTLPFQAQAYKVQQSELPLLSVLTFSPYAKASAMSAILDKQLQPVIKGQVSLDTAIGQINTSINALLSQGKELVG